MQTLQKITKVDENLRKLTKKVVKRLKKSEDFFRIEPCVYRIALGEFFGCSLPILTLIFVDFGEVW